MLDSSSTRTSHPFQLYQKIEIVCDTMKTNVEIGKETVEKCLELGKEWNFLDSFWFSFLLLSSFCICLMTSSIENCSLLTRALPLVAYFFRNGPWRSVWCRYGYDPRKIPSAKMYLLLIIHSICTYYVFLSFGFFSNALFSIVLNNYSYQILDFRVSEDQVRSDKLRTTEIKKRPRRSIIRQVDVHKLTSADNNKNEK